MFAWLTNYECKMLHQQQNDLHISHIGYTERSIKIEYALVYDSFI